MNTPRNPRIPGATYRIQLTKDFTFKDALGLIDYWHALGITDIYAAPFFKARPGSVHGYDVVDPAAINPEIGSERDLELFHEALAARDMGLLIDVVPNHMCVSTNENVWWNNVLENGPSSPHAAFFDIDWRPPKAELHDKVLLPVLGDQYGRILEAGELRLAEEGGALYVHYHDKRFPVGPGTYPMVLDGVMARLKQGRFPKVATALGAVIERARGLPARSETAPDRVLQRQRDKEIIKADLRQLLSSPALRAAFDDELTAFNGLKGDSRSFDRLEQLLAVQAYRLSFWRVAAEQINYRRFFEINDLGAICIERPQVLEAVHGKAFELLRKGWASGLRIDHVDGLREPRQYLDQVAAHTDGAYVVVEKILAAGERLPHTWAAEGTSGYEFLNILNGVFVARTGERPLRALYDGLRTVAGGPTDIAHDAKLLILQAAMASELSVLTRRLDRISEQHRWSRDFTLGTLQLVLAETIACFPVYRTYIAEDDAEVAPQDIAHIRVALTEARRRQPTIDPSLFDFLGDVLLMRDPEGISDVQRGERRDFLMRFQQLTGPVMAKGVEDTMFYRYFPLLSLNEVGGGPEQFGLSVEEFHRLMADRARERPGALSATATHDTKRGEDARARLDVLSEIPDAWSAAVTEWRELAERLKPKVAGRPCPDADDEYYIYQTLVGALPPLHVDGEAAATFKARVEGAIEKAMREAKRNTSWISPNGAYEEATKTFLARVLDPSGPLLDKIQTFVAGICRAGLLTALSQLVIKATAPGVPDFFQGSELWDFSMVDPDNRRAVDYDTRRHRLEALGAVRGADAASSIERIWQSMPAGDIKLFITHALLLCRRQEADLFAHGSYTPLEVSGPRRDNVVAFARRWQKRIVITIAARHFTQLPEETGEIRGSAARSWADTQIHFPEDWAVEDFRDALTGATATTSHGSLPLVRVFGTLPFAVLVGSETVPGSGDLPR